MNSKPSARKGFTLIELLIVCAILPVMAVAMFSLINRVQSGAAGIAERMNSAERTSAALARWRTDVSLASAVEVLADGRAMRVARLGPEGERLNIRYELGASGHMTRRLEGEGEERLVGNVEELRFERAGHAYRMTIGLSWTDGARRWAWKSGGSATPLAAGGFIDEGIQS